MDKVAFNTITWLWYVVYVLININSSSILSFQDYSWIQSFGSDQGSHKLEKYSGMEGTHEEFLKIKSAWISAGELL